MRTQILFRILMPGLCKFDFPVLWQMIQITRSGCYLIGRGGRRLPRRSVEVKEFGHIHLGGIARRQAVQVEPRFNQL
jgi:hypothetical protein